MELLSTAVLISVIAIEVGVLFYMLFVMPEGKAMMKDLKEWFKK